ncbi:MAG: hypothetical protein V4669_16220 [Pseudomonadota bacterium]
MQPSEATVRQLRIPNPPLQDFADAAQVTPAADRPLPAAARMAIAEPLPPRVHLPHIPVATLARDLLVTALDGNDSAVDGRDVGAAITRLLSLSPQLGDSEVDRLLCGVLHEALVKSRETVIEAWVEAIAGAPANLMDLPRRLELLKGAVQPAAPRSWNPAAAGHSPAAYAGPPLLVRIFNTRKAHKDFPAAERWKATLTASEHNLATGAYALVTALLDSPHVTDAQASEILCTTFNSVGRDETTDQITRKELNALNFAMHQGHLCAAGYILMAIGNSDRSLVSKAQLTHDIGLDRAQLKARLDVLRKMPVPCDADRDGYKWARGMARWCRDFLSACDLVAEMGRVQLATDDEASLRQCLHGNLLGTDFETATDVRPASLVCTSRIALPDFSDVEVAQINGQPPPAGKRMYAIPLFALEPRASFLLG